MLYRARTGLVHYEQALAAAGIPYWQAGAPHLGERQEVLDVVNVLRLLGNRRDDLRALGFLRSPFVCLRDEIVAAIRLDAPQRPLLDAARRALDARWFVAPEHDGLSEIEREALRRGLDAYEALRALAPRIPVDELIEELLERTGYRNHLRLRDRAEEALANLRTFIHWCADYRHLALEQLLDVWDRWSSQDRGIPQAPLYSAEDDVVTLTTIHAAKGLEWPVVFLIESENTLVRDPRAGYMTDRALGPMLAGARAERGPRAERLARRHRLEERAEVARLLYVAMTRARQRLIVIAGEGRPGTHAAWLAAAADDIPGARRPVPAAPAAVVAPTPPGLDWLERIEIGRLAASARPLDPPPLRFVVSATEMMMRQDAPEEWERRFVHAVEPAGQSPGRARDGSIPARMRGTVIHGVLERVREAAEISRILEETLGSIDEPGLDRALAPGSGLREQLEDEIRGVVESTEWAWYVAGEHERELPFVHLAGAHEWRIGAFDLVRLGERNAAAPTGEQLDLFAGPGPGATTGSAMIVDFKTHRIDASEAAAVADRYALQARVYREAAEIGAPARVRFHFTWPNVAVDA